MWRYGSGNRESGGVRLNKGKIRKREFYSVENFRNPNESSEGRLLMEIRSVYAVSAKAARGYETSHHQLNELKAHLVLRQEPEGPTGFIEGGGGLNLQLQGGKECCKIQITRQWLLQLQDNKSSPGEGSVFQHGSAREDSRKLQLKVPLSSTDVSSCDLFTT